MLVAVAVVQEHLLAGFLGGLGGDVPGPVRLRRGRRRQLEHAERHARIPVRDSGDVAERVVRSAHALVAESPRVLERPAQNPLDFVRGKRFEPKQARSRHQRVTSWNGFLVVAPIKTTVPSSTSNT